jgi:hypothetical protein
MSAAGGLFLILLEIGFIESSQIIEIQRGIKPCIFGFRGSKPGQDSFNLRTSAMGAGCRRLIGQAQYQDGAVFFTIEAEVFMQGHLIIFL